MTDIPTDAFNKWHPDKASAFPAQAVDVIHYLQEQCRAADAEVEQLKDDNALLTKAVERNYSVKNLKIRDLRAEVEAAETYSKALSPTIDTLRARIAELEAIPEYVNTQNEIEIASLRTEVERYKAMWIAQRLDNEKLKEELLSAR